MQIFKVFRSYVFFGLCILLTTSACAPVCLAIPDTSFVATVLEVDASSQPKVIVRYNQYTLRVMLDEQTPILDAMGKALSYSTLVRGQEFSIQGVLTAPNVVQASELRQLIQLN